MAWSVLHGGFCVAVRLFPALRACHVVGSADEFHVPMFCVPRPHPPQVSRRLLSKPQDALEGVVLSVSGAAVSGL